ncbi:hypothetical protein B0T25DRAFT_589982 [Lasiosphaeria hispida]|uniref:Uncharacterized protein n=1 Tax=Lasiosphaeria hispida TaxID=260671 RepID=A0AAJ0HNG5_9PEZI|nr:hypothetical protein B0T25DRAFT_589982 [Lasiosphaeria hispida]
MKGHGISSLLRLLALLLLVVFTTNNPPPESSASQNPSPTSAPPPQSSNSGTPSSSSSGTPSTTRSSGGGGGGGNAPSNPSSTNPPDVLLRVPELRVGRIELDVDNLRAEVNLAAEIANLVTINAGVQIGIEKVNITIADVEAELELIIRLGRLVEIVNRTLASLDLNPLLINLLNEVTDVVDAVVGAVDGLLGSILQGGTKLNFLIDNLGNIIQEVVGEAGSLVSSIVGNYQSNMTYTGVQKELGNGLTQKTYKYDALGSLVNIITNTLGQVVQAVVIGKDGNGGGGGGGGGSSTTAAPSSSATQSSAAPSQTSTASG